MKKIIHRFIKWYLFRVGGAFHTGKYNTPDGYYIVLCSESEYHQLQEIQI